MANKYGEAALLAARMNTYGKALTAAERWDEAVKQVYPASTAGQKKSSPRGAFIGLCDAGLVAGIGANQSGKLGLNRDYAVEAVRLLRAGTHKTTSQLWAAVADEGKTPDAQMDVVLALWKNGLIAPVATMTANDTEQHGNDHDICPGIEPWQSLKHPVWCCL